MCRKKVEKNEQQQQAHENIYYNNSAMTMKEYWAVAYKCEHMQRFRSF